LACPWINLPLARKSRRPTAPGTRSRLLPELKLRLSRNVRFPPASMLLGGQIMNTLLVGLIAFVSTAAGHSAPSPAGDYLCKLPAGRASAAFTWREQARLPPLRRTVL
jgi:hypothetical protein